MRINAFYKRARFKLYEIINLILNDMKDQQNHPQDLEKKDRDQVKSDRKKEAEGEERRKQQEKNKDLTEQNDHQVHSGNNPKPTDPEKMEKQNSEIGQEQNGLANEKSEDEKPREANSRKVKEEATHRQKSKKIEEGKTNPESFGS